VSDPNFDELVRTQIEKSMRVGMVLYRNQVIRILELLKRNHENNSTPICDALDSALAAVREIQI
jgi:hypothetical protein